MLDQAKSDANMRSEGGPHTVGTNQKVTTPDLPAGPPDQTKPALENAHSSCRLVLLV